MEKQLFKSTILIFILIPLSFSQEPSPLKRSTGTLTGTVSDAQNQPVVRAFVILCDQSSGIPVCQDTFRPFTEAYLSKERDRQKEICFTVTDDRGRFSFENVFVGEYKVVAQSWKGVEEIKSIFERNGGEIQLCGVAEHIEVFLEAVSSVVLRPLGTGVLQINEDAPNDETLLVLSTSPTRADPILGFTGWGGAFMQHMIGGNRMPKGRTTVYGLPEGRIYLAMFAADSVPGWTQGQAQIKPNATTVLEYIPFVNSWSNSRHDPPEDLLPVFEEVKPLVLQNRRYVIDLLQNYDVPLDSLKGMWAFMEHIGPHLEKEVVLPSGRKATFGEVLASAQYVQLQKTMERKRAQWQKRDEAMKKFQERWAAKEKKGRDKSVKIREKVNVSSPLSFFPDDMEGAKELDELWAVKNQAFNIVSPEEILEIIRKGFRRTSADKNDMIRTIGSRYIWNKSPSEPAAVDILYCASFDSDVMYNAFYYGLTVAKPKPPMVLSRLAKLAMQGYGVGRIAWGIGSVQDQREEFIDLLKPYLNSHDSTERQQAQNIIRVIDAKRHRVYGTGKGETNPKDIEMIRKDFGDKLNQLRQTLLTGTSSSRLAEIERICSLGLFHLFDDTFIPAVRACAQDQSPKVRIKTAEIAGYYWIWGDTMKNSEIIQLLIALSEDGVQEVRFAAVEKGLFNLPDKTVDVIRRIIDMTLADRKQMSEKLYKRIEYVLRVNKPIARDILMEYLESSQSNQDVVTALYRDALRLDPATIQQELSTSQKD